MKSRDELQFSIENILITDDALFESLTEEEQNSFAKYCIEVAPFEFERCILILLKNYNWILIKSPLLEAEHAILDTSGYLNEHVQIFNTRFDEILSKLNQQITTSHQLLRAVTDKEHACQLHAAAELKVSSAKKDQASIEMAISKTKLFIEQWNTKESDIHKKSIEEAQQTLADLEGQLENAKEKMAQAESEAEITTQDVLSADKKIETLNTTKITEVISPDPNNPSIYDSTMFNLQLIQANMMNQMKQMSEQCNALMRQSNTMIELTENQGLIKIQSRLEFCMNILMTVPYTKLAKDAGSIPYYSITKSFGEFWYHHGEKLVPESRLREEKDNLHIKNLMSLIFYFMSNSIEDTLEVRLCVMQIFQYITNTPLSVKDAHEFSPVTFAKKSPDKFITLFQYLFESDNQFKDTITPLIEQKYIYVLYNLALFQLFASKAWQETGNKKYAEQLKNQALQGLLNAFENGIADAEYWLVKYFYKDFNVKIALAIIYFKNELPEQHDLSSIIYQHLKKNVFELEANIIELFFYWMTYNKNDIRLFASGWIEILSKSHNASAWAVLLRNANHHVDYAVTIAQIALASGDTEMKQQALQVMMYHPDQYDSNISYHKFLIIKDIYKEWNVTALVIAAKQKHPEAGNLLKANYESNLALRQEVRTQITEEQNSKPVYLLNLLKDLYISRSPVISVDDIDNLKFFNIFFSFLSNSFPRPKEIELLKNLNDYASQKFLNAYEALLSYARHNIEAAFVLAKHLLTEMHSDNPLIKEYAIKLISLFKQYYKDHNASEKEYFMYVLEKYAYGVSSPDYLIDSCVEAYLPAVLEMDTLLNSSPCNLDILRIEFYIDLLHCLVKTFNSSTYAAAEALCIRHITDNNYSTACFYFEICSDTPDSLHKLCSRLEKQKCMNIFLRACNKKIFELIPESFKSAQYGQYSVKSRITLFENISNTKHDKQEASQAGMHL